MNTFCADCDPWTWNFFAKHSRREPMRLAVWNMRRRLTLDPYLNMNLERSLFYRTDFDALFSQPDEPFFKRYLDQHQDSVR